MSDELAKGTGLGAVATALLGVLWAAFLRKGEKAEDKVESDRDSRLEHLEQRLEGALANHATRISAAELRLENVDTRLKSREGLQGEQHTGVTFLTPSQRALLAQIAEEARK